jgi:hypothetical protein
MVDELYVVDVDELYVVSTWTSCMLSTSTSFCACLPRKRTLAGTCAFLQPVHTAPTPFGLSCIWAVTLPASARSYLPPPPLLAFPASLHTCYLHRVWTDL